MSAVLHSTSPCKVEIVVGIWPLSVSFFLLLLSFGI